MEKERSSFKEDLVGALMVEGYDLLFAVYAVVLLKLERIDPFGEDFPILRKALESLGVSDLPTLRERLVG